MDLGLKGKRALVLSSSRGLGRGIAEALAAEGADVLLTARTAERLNEAVAAINARGQGRAYAFAGSLKDNVEAIHAAAQEHLGGVDILIANTGGPPAGTALTVQPEAWTPQFEAMVTPVFRLAGTRLCALIGHELRGRAFTALWPDVEAQGDMRRLVQTVMDETAGAVAGLSGESSTGAPIYLELLLLPLRYRGRTHARILGSLSPALSPDWLGLDTVATMRMISLRMLWPAAASRAAAPEPQRAGPPRLVVLPGGRA